MQARFDLLVARIVHHTPRARGPSLTGRRLDHGQADIGRGGITSGHCLGTPGRERRRWSLLGVHWERGPAAHLDMLASLLVRVMRRVGMARG
jgi:hypothetical protein